MNQSHSIRRGLHESLEEFAARLGVSRDSARVRWRIEGLRLLFPRVSFVEHPIEWFVSLCSEGICAIAPGASVPTKPVHWSDADWDTYMDDDT